MQTWHAVLAGSAMIAGAVALRPEAVAPAHAQVQRYTPAAAQCILDTMRTGASLGNRAAELLAEVCRTLERPGESIIRLEGERAPD